ncbi:plasmid partitioning protein RepB C-terminal domain-containing protein [Rhizobacter sp. P5_C2]
MTALDTSARLAFNPTYLKLELDQLHSNKVPTQSVLSGAKYQQILGSIRAVGLLDPLVVVPRSQYEGGGYLVLDGWLRKVALREADLNSAQCRILTDCEGLTYNRQVKRLSAVQEHLLIVRAAEGGASMASLSQALGISAESTRDRLRMLDGICLEAVQLLADKPATRGLFKALQQMKPSRQTDVAQAMIDLRNYSVKFSLVMLHASPAELLAEDAQAHRQANAPSEARQRLQREMATVESNAKRLEETYGPNCLQLVVVKAYIRSLLENAKVVGWLARNRGDYLRELQLIAEIEVLDPVTWQSPKA